MKETNEGSKRPEEQPDPTQGSAVRGWVLLQGKSGCLERAGDELRRQGARIWLQKKVLERTRGFGGLSQAVGDSD